MSSAANPPGLRATFGEIQTAYALFAGEFDVQAGTEMACTVHGIATLDRSGRLVDDLREEHIRVLLGYGPTRADCRLGQGIDG